jgi:hypothetical protein
MHFGSLLAKIMEEAFQKLYRLWRQRNLKLCASTWSSQQTAWYNRLIDMGCYRQYESHVVGI